MSDYTTTIDGPAQLQLTEEKRLKHTATVNDAAGAPLIQFEPGKRNHQSVLIGDSTIRMDSHMGLFKIKLTAVGPDETVLAEIDGDTVSYEGTDYALRRQRRSLPVPWVLSGPGGELGTFTHQALGRNIAIELSGAGPVPLGLIAFCCEWVRLRAAKDNAN